MTRVFKGYTTTTLWRLPQVICDEEGFGPFAGLYCIDNPGHKGGHLYAESPVWDYTGVVERLASLQAFTTALDLDHSSAEALAAELRARGEYAQSALDNRGVVGQLSGRSSGNTVRESARAAASILGPHLDVDWNSICNVLRSDGTGAHVASFANPAEAQAFVDLSRAIGPLLEVLDTERSATQREATLTDGPH